jgi:putative glutamine amidotransferase
MRPIILVTTDRRPFGPARPGPRVRPPRPEAWLGEAYIDAIRRAGGNPVLVPPGPTEIDALLVIAHGVVITGGHFDIHPSRYGRPVSARLDRVDDGRTDLELDLAKTCLDREIPVLGVCGGHQALAVAAGGTLIQDLPTELVRHEQPTDPATPWHDVRCEDAAAQLFGPRIRVNSTHHQGVESPGDRFRALAWAPDDTVEAIVASDHPFAVGVQWHPELLGDDRVYRALILSAPRVAAHPERAPCSRSS